jgi:hypothetical protein
MKQHFRQFVPNSLASDEATASIQNNNKSKDFKREVLLSVGAENGKQVHGSLTCTLPPSPREWFNLEQSAKESLVGVKEGIQVKYLIPPGEELPDEQDQGTSDFTLPLSPLQRVSLEQSAKEILLGVKKAVKVEYLIPAKEEGDR